MKKKVAIIGYGSMGKMLSNKMLESGTVCEDDLLVSNRTIEKLDTLKKKYPNITICSNKEAAKGADLIFVCVRPVDMKSVLEEIKEYVSQDKHIISLNGCIGLEQLESVLTGKISKVIPSITGEVDASQTLVCHNDLVNQEDREDLNACLHSFGSVIELPEHEMGMGGELVSCMPGFLAAIVDVIAKSAQKHTGIEPREITRMIFETMYGTSKLVKEQNIPIDTLIARVATKGGITEEGTKVIEEDFPSVMDELFEKTLEKRKIISDKAKKSF